MARVTSWSSLASLQFLWSSAAQVGTFPGLLRGAMEVEDRVPALGIQIHYQKECLSVRRVLKPVEKK